MNDPDLGFLAGRRRERAALASGVDRGLAGYPGLVVVCGEAGIGKTALVEDLARQARLRPVRVVSGAADERDRSAFALWRGPCSRLDVAMGDVDRTIPAQERRWELLSQLIEAMGRAAPMVVLLEDLQWADELSLWVLGRLCAGLVGHELAVVATCRDDGAGPPLVASLRPAVVVRLSGLSPDEVALLATHLEPGREIDAGDLWQRTGGNPLFVREVLAWGRERGRVPPVVGSVLERSLQRLDEVTRRALAAGALAGPDAPFAVLGTATELGPRDLRACFDRAKAAGFLIKSPAGRLQFRHALIADAAIELVGPDGESQLQRSLARGWALSPSAPRALERCAASLLAAVPLVDPREAAETARRAGSEAITGGDPTAAVSLLQAAAASLEVHAPEARELRAALLVDLGEALDMVGSVTRCAAAFEEAGAIATGCGETRVRALAATGAARHLNIFVENPRHRLELADAEESLPPGDDPLRVALLGRLAVVDCAASEHQERSRLLGEQAVVMARRLGDPRVLATALIDHHLASAVSVDTGERCREAAELIALGERCQRTDLVLTGYQWLYDARLNKGELNEAKQALQSYEMLSSLMPSPSWRYGAMLRSSMLMVLEGERQLGLDLLDRATPLGRAALPEAEAIGLEHGVRTITARLTGVADLRLPGVHEEAVHVAGHLPVAFFQLHLAASHLLVGDEATARRSVARWASDIAHITPAFQAPNLISLLGALVADLSMVEHARLVRETLAPFSGIYSLEHGFGADMPIDATLGRLAFLEGDLEAAEHHLQIALGFACSMRSPVLEANCLWYLAQAQRALGAGRVASEMLRKATALAAGARIVLPGEGELTSSAANPPAQAALTRNANRWRVDSPYGSGELTQSMGLEYLARILAAAPAEIASVDLAGSGRVRPLADLGPVLDATAKRAYRRRLNELRTEIDEAEAGADIERAAQHRLELEALMAELSRAVGLGGRDRPHGSGAERARVNVVRAIQRAFSNMGELLPDLEAHLRVSVRTGRYCTYSPDPAAALVWKVST